ncbi:MAG: type II toxin-antitoxin system VapC family toxin [Polyangiaceae bacterium]|nr:type II toxin-antitoxin system VapC family toxin [Polyangiaceae bacterium]
MTYLVDANVLAYFWNVGQQTALAESAAKLALATPEEVSEELGRSPKYGAQFRKWIASSGVGVLPIEAMSAVDETFTALHPDRTALRGKGEHACIALAAHDPSLVFVANDKNALWLALHELHAEGARVIGVRVFLRRLQEQAGLGLVAVDQVARAAQGPTPSWWQGWRAKLGPGAQP